MSAAPARKRSIANPRSSSPTNPRSASETPKPAAPSGRDPDHHTVLLAVTGMSPAILTETIWALAHEAEPVIPARVIAVTTTGGRAELERQLFEPDPRFAGRCPWDALREALAAAGHHMKGRLRFGTTADDIRVITAADPISGRTRELVDLRTATENEAAADFVLEQVRSLAENPDVHLIASIAGGRKTMGATLYAAVCLAARETDRVTHVLVSEPFETLRGFWFPGQPGGPIADRHGQAHDPSTARIELADLPFVPLRNLFQRELGRPAGSFLRLVDACRESVRRAAGEGVKLVVERSRCEIDVNGTRVKLAPKEQGVLLFLAERAKADEPRLDRFEDALDGLEDFRKTLAKSAPIEDFSDWRHATAINEAWNKDGADQALRRALSSMRGKLRQAGGNAHLLVPCLPEKGRFALTVPGPMIFIRD
ncbi:MAG: CRISPR-associated ring nuclease Csm6 [Limisphaerales bacterium]